MLLLCWNYCNTNFFSIQIIYCYPFNIFGRFFLSFFIEIPQKYVILSVKSVNLLTIVSLPLRFCYRFCVKGAIDSIAFADKISLPYEGVPFYVSGCILEWHFLLYLWPYLSQVWPFLLQGAGTYPAFMIQRRYSYGNQSCCHGNHRRG